MVTGWGVTVSTTNDDPTAPSADILQEIVLPITSEEVCTAFVNTFIDGVNKPTSWPSLLCVGTGEDNKGTCFGDSGGPIIVQKEQEDTWTLAGLVSGKNRYLTLDCLIRG